MEAVLKKKKKKKDNYLRMGVSEIGEEEAQKFVKGLKTRICKAFKGHVGESKAITPYDLFIKVFNVNPDMVDIYKRTYWWNVVMRILHDMRKDGSMFVINKRKYLFVLKSKDESDGFRRRLDATIRAIENTQDRADDWVKSRKWKSFELGGR